MTTPDFLADEADPFWRFSDASMHRACFLVWDRRKAFVARYNRAAPGGFQDDERWGEGDEARGEFGEAGVIIGDGPALPIGERGDVERRFRDIDAGVVVQERLHGGKRPTWPNLA